MNFGRLSKWASAPSPRRAAFRSAKISKIENHKLDVGDFPSEAVIEKLGTYAIDLMVLAEKVPEPIRRRVLERPDVFRKLALLDDATLDRLVERLDPTATGSQKH